MKLDDLTRLWGSNEKCLDKIFNKRKKKCSCGKDKYYYLKGTTAYVCSCGKKFYPLVGTIFEKSRTPLKMWFYVMYLFSKAKSGLSAMFISSITGLTYKCAWRMLHKIRELMKETSKVSGRVEMDETFMAPKRWRNSRIRKSRWDYPQLIGAVNSHGKVRTKVIYATNSHDVREFLKDNVAKNSHIHTDGGTHYIKLGFKHSSYQHWANFKPGENSFIRTSGDSTQRIENFWSQLKRVIYGTYRRVKYLQSYANEIAYRYSHRGNISIFEVLLNHI